MNIIGLSLDRPSASPFRSALASPELQPILDTVRPALRPAARVFVVGGFLRRAARIEVEGVTEPVGDLDLIVDDPDPLALPAGSLPGRITRNVFKGYRWFAPGAFRHIDLWRLADHYSIRLFNRPSTIQMAMQGFPFNVERAAVDVTREIAYDGGCLNSVRERLIRFDAEDVYLEHLQTVRAVLLQRKTGFAFDHSVLALLAARPWDSMKGEIRHYLELDGWVSSCIDPLFDELDVLGRSAGVMERADDGRSRKVPGASRR
jgi:hypothetical protein